MLTLYFCTVVKRVYLNLKPAYIWQQNCCHFCTELLKKKYILDRLTQNLTPPLVLIYEFFVSRCSPWEAPVGAHHRP